MQLNKLVTNPDYGATLLLSIIFIFGVALSFALYDPDKPIPSEKPSKIPLEVPVNLDELAIWDYHKLNKLKEELKCHKVQDTYSHHLVKKSEILMKWFDTCKKVDIYWADAYERLKVQELEEKARKVGIK